MDYPNCKTFCVHPHLRGGCYPGTPVPHQQRTMLASLLALGVRTFINLQERDECNAAGQPFADYTPTIHALASEAKVAVDLHRFPIRDQGVPTVAQMRTILTCIDAAIARAHCVYVHCWGGNGRTGTVIGCWLVEQGRTPGEAIRDMADARRNRQFSQPAPETEAQRRFIHTWPSHR